MNRRLYLLSAVTALVAIGVLWALASKSAPEPTSEPTSEPRTAIDRTSAAATAAQPHSTTIRFDLDGPAALSPQATSEPTIAVFGITGPVTKMSVSLFVSGFDPEDGTQLAMVRPDQGQSVLLTPPARVLSFGTGCSPESARITFDDEAGTAITSRQWPYEGALRPLEPLAAFVGLPPSAVNGTWRLPIANLGEMAALLQCASIFITTATADLGASMPAAPKLVAAGADLGHAIAMRNNGPDDAGNVRVEMSTPSGTTFVHAIAPVSFCVNGSSVPGSTTFQSGDAAFVNLKGVFS